MKYLVVHLLFAFKLFMYHLIVKASYHFAYAHGLMHGFMAIVIGALIVTVPAYWYGITTGATRATSGHNIKNNLAFS